MSFLFSQPAPGILPNDSVSFSELVNINANSVLGNPTALATDGSSISFIDLTQDHLSLFSSTEQGVVPASGGGTTNFLRADGTWVAAGVSTAGALDQQVLAYDSGTGLTTWQYAGLGDGSLGTNNLILGRAKPIGLTGTKNIIISDTAMPSATTSTSNVVIGTDGTGSTLVDQSYLTLIGVGQNTTGNINNSVVIGSRAYAAFSFQSVVIGDQASNVGYERNVSIGSPAYTPRTYSVSIGWNSTARLAGVSLGASAISYGDYNTLLGYNTIGSGDGGVAIGVNASVFSTFAGSVAIGANSSTTAEQSISIGSQSTATAVGQISLGHYAGKNGIGSNRGLFLGNYSTNRIGEGSNVCFFGGQAQNNGQINTVYFSQGGEASLGANLLPFTMTVTPATGTDQNASPGTFTIAGAKGTGTGVGGDIILSTSPASGVSGSTRNASVEVMRVTATGNVGIGTTSPGQKLEVNGNVKVSNGDLSIATIGKGLAIKSGTNAKIGTTTFTAQNTVTVSTTALTANSLIFVTGQDGTDAFCVGNKNAGAGTFDIVHTSGNTTAVVAWMIVEAIP